jgi:hypothetical protein
MNAWEKEARKKGGIWVRTWKFLDRDDATHARAAALNRIRFMESEYSGCDWCDGCGDGLREMEFYQSVAKLANNFLEEEKM